MRQRLARGTESNRTHQLQHRRAALVVEALEGRDLLSASSLPGVMLPPSGAAPADSPDSILVAYRGEEELRTVQLAPGASLDDALAAYRADPNVLHVDPNYRLHLNRTPNDTYFGYQFGQHNTGQTGGKSDADMDAV